MSQPEKMNPESAATSTAANAPIVEEDWSQYMNTSSGICNGDRHVDDSQDHSFSYYDTVFVPLSAKIDDRDRNFREGEERRPHPLVMEIRCMKSLTPMDMLDLSNGLSDATGNRIWMGAVFFLECIVREIDVKDEHQETDRSSCSFHQNLRRALMDVRSRLFQGKAILELGSGTGAALIAVGMARSNMGEILLTGSPNKKRILPSVMILTDNDATVLSLCQINCDRNLCRDEKATVDYRVGKLDWGLFSGIQCGDESPQYSPSNEQEDHFFIDSDRLRGTLDTVIATDVIYDVAVIPLLMATAEALLRDGGFFVLAHVPRASIDCDLSRIRDALEELVISEARKVGLETNLSELEASRNIGADTKCWEVLFGDERASIIRPNVLAQVWSNSCNSQEESQSLENNKTCPSVSSDYDYEELESCGASIMIFMKESYDKPSDR